MSEGTITKEYAVEIKQLGDKIAELSLKQAAELSEYLEQVHGIKAAAGAVMVAGAAPGAAAEGSGEAEEAAEPTEFDLILTATPEKKIEVIKVVRELTSLGLKEAKAKVDSLPSKILEGVAKGTAETGLKKLTETGAQAEVKAVG